jgi:transitional endoplasmic reticulum ATPase
VAQSTKKARIVQQFDEPPEWEQTLLAKGILFQAFLLHGNLQDYPRGIAGASLRNYLMIEVVKQTAARDIVVYYDRWSGFRFLRPREMQRRFIEVTGLQSPVAQEGRAGALNASIGVTEDTAALERLEKAGRDPLTALHLLDKMLHYTPAPTAPQVVKKARERLLAIAEQVLSTGQQARIEELRSSLGRIDIPPADTHDGRAAGGRKEEAEVGRFLFFESPTVWYVEDRGEQGKQIFRLEEAARLVSELQQLQKQVPAPPLRATVILGYGDSLAPGGNTSSEADRTLYVALSEWGRDMTIGERGHMLIMLVDELSGIDERLCRSSARWEQVEIPYPSPEQREAFARMHVGEPGSGQEVELAQGLTHRDLAHLTTGLRLIDIHDIILRARAEGLVVSPELILARKKEIIQTEFGSVLTITESASGFEALGGIDYLRDYLLEEVVTPLREGLRAQVPKGVLFLGPYGSGKSAIARAAAHDAHVCFCELQPHQLLGELVGRSQRLLEKALNAIKSMTPTIVYIDEIDQTFKRGGSLDSNVGNNQFKRLAETMADPYWQGRILWWAASNRPDLMDGALLRPGRFDLKIGVLLPKKLARASILAKLVSRCFADMPGTLPTQEDYLDLAEGMDNYSPAELELVATKALRLAVRHREWDILTALREGAGRIVPTTRDIERLTDMALFHTSDLDALEDEEMRERARMLRREMTTIQYGAEGDELRLVAGSHRQ